MATRLLVIRHGQASAMASDYDVLSELGREQSRQLGPWLSRWAAEPTRVMVGPRRRHLGTYEEARGNAADSWPEFEACELLDEHHGIQLVHHLGGELSQRGDEVGALARAAMDDPTSAGSTRAWLKMLREVLLLWSRGELEHDDVEPWRVFRERVRRFLRLAAERPGTVLAFTSGGAIGAMVGEILGVDEARTLELCWAVRNASVTEILLTQRAPMLVGFNSTSHLGRDELVTYV